jgi:excisionase family DNA binding protein
MGEQELIPLNEAAKRLGISKMTMARLVKEGRFAIYENPLDRRQKLVEATEIEAAIRPRQIHSGQQVKAAA